MFDGEEVMKVAVVGAGLTGLVAANELKEYSQVKVFEAEEVGGLVSSYFNDSKGYHIEKFYHHCFKNDFELLKLLKDLKLSSKLVWKTVKVGTAFDGKIFSLSTPFEILRYPHLKISEKIKLAMFTIKSRRRSYEAFDDESALDGLKREVGEALMKKFFMPLLNAKFGENARDVSYAWLLARVAIRSNRKLKGEEIGYLRHGFWQIIEKLSEDIEIKKEKAKIEKSERWTVNGEEFDAVVFTAPLNELNINLNLPDVRYQSSVCALIALKNSMSDVYWVNSIGTTFGAIIEHTNFMPFEDYGENLIYLASYTTPNSGFFMREDKEILKIFLSDLKKFGVEERDLLWSKVFKAKYSGPIYERGYSKKITPYRVAEGFYIAGMTSEPNYPERSMNGSIKAGKEVAEKLKKDFELS